MTQSDIPIEARGLRSTLIAWCTIASVVTAWICSTLDDMGYWLIPLLLATAAFRMAYLTLTLRRPSFVTALFANLFELSFIASLVIIGFLLIEIWLLSVPLDDKTVERLQHWQEHAEVVHKCVEQYAPKWWTFLIAVAVSVALGAVAQVRPSLAGISERVTIVLALAAKWIGRVSTAIALIASLSLLATDENRGILRHISLTLQDTKKKYDDFASNIEQQTDAVLRKSFLAQAWQQRPPEFKRKIDLAVRFVKERDAYDEMRREARDRFQISAVTPQQSFPETFAADGNRVIDATDRGQVPGYLTPSDLQHAAQEAEDLSHSTDNQNGNDEANGAKDEIAQKLLEKILALQFSKHAASLGIVKSYPVIGELADAVLATISETVFARSRELIVRQVIQLKLANPGKSLQEMINSAVREVVQRHQPSLKGFNSAWRARTNELLLTYLRNLRSSSNQLELQSHKQLREQIEVAEMEALQKSQLLLTVAAAIDSSSLKHKSRAIDRYVGQLALTGVEWPALQQPPIRLRNKFDRISARMANDTALNSQVPLKPTPAVLPTSQQNEVLREQGKATLGREDADISEILLPEEPDLMNDPHLFPAGKYGGTILPDRKKSRIEPDPPELLSKGDPLQQITAISSYCDDVLVALVGASDGHQRGLAILKNALGVRYENYYQSWSAQKRSKLAALEEARKEEEQRRAQEEFRREIQREREYEAIHPEHEAIP